MDAIRLDEAMSEHTLLLDVPPFKTKDELFEAMTSSLAKTGAIDDEQEFLKALYYREETGPTYMGNQIAIPHGKSTTVKKATVSFCRLTQPMIYESCNESGEVSLIFMLAIPGECEAEEYLKILATLVRMLMYEEFIDGVENASDYQTITRLFTQFQNRLD